MSAGVRTPGGIPRSQHWAYTRGHSHEPKSGNRTDRSPPYIPTEQHKLTMLGVHDGGSAPTDCCTASAAARRACTSISWRRSLFTDSLGQGDGEVGQRVGGA